MAGDFDIGPADYEADMNGKGDTPRPIVIDSETYKKNWEQTFSERDKPNLCDTFGPNGSCLACVKGLEHINEPIHFIDRTEDVYRVPIKLRRSLETLGDPEE